MPGNVGAPPKAHKKKQYPGGPNFTPGTDAKKGPRKHSPPQ